MLIDALVDNLAKYEMKDGSVEYTFHRRDDGKPYASDVNKVKQGDGQMLVGDASAVLASKTSLDYNYNVVGYTNTANSPTPGTVSGYIDQMIYEILIDGDALTDKKRQFYLRRRGNDPGPPLARKDRPGPHRGRPRLIRPAGRPPSPATMLLLGSAFMGFGLRRFWRR